MSAREALTRIVVVDDEPLAIRGLRVSLGRVPGVELVGTARDGVEGLEVIRREKPDIVLLDILMPRLDGLALAEALAEAEGPAVIFVTAYGQFAVNAFEVAAVDYLMKPVTLPRLRAAIQRAQDRLAADSAQQRAEEMQRVIDGIRGAESRELESAGAGRSLWISDARGRTRVPLTQIDWFEAQRDYVRIHAGSDTFIQRGTLADLEGKLDSSMFQRIHRSAIVNLQAVRALRRRAWSLCAVTLRSGEEAPIGRSYLAELKAKLKQYDITSIRAAD
ncbi:MAG: LytTR family DNA-binding domain-containing protein [Caulobacteraceae bacterium]|nr:LytTR family DNA-binding domain-containing protein [Caulobacteraceae bacterium]